jgi:hypothetical protein
MKKVLTLGLFLVVTLVSVAKAQECGPSCPVCSGNSGGNLMAPKSLLFTGMAIPSSEEERGVVNVRYGVFNWMDAGIGYAFDTKKPIWSLRLQPVTEEEDGWRPGLVVGLGSVQAGGSDQSIYSQATKSWEFGEPFALRASAGVATLLPDFEKVFGIAGITTSFYDKYSLFVNYDGTNFHEGVSWIPLNWLTVSVLAVETEYPAVSVAFKWQLSKDDGKEDKE